MNKKSKSILDHYSEYEATIGIEVHVQLKTKTKIFCACPNSFGAPVNSNICRVCTGMLGSLPVLNLQAVNYAIAIGLATNCSITKLSEFARKHYMYPDLPKNYQISQDGKPICADGYLNISIGENGEKKQIRIQRIHMEEDAGKNSHGEDEQAHSSFVDLNRAGAPLVEIVTHPDICSADEAVAYLELLHSVVKYTGVSDANMERGSFRADVNVSVKKKVDKKLGTRAELKNINSFKYIHDAIEFELERQINILESGGKVQQETRLWDSIKKESKFMRSKADAEDYRYLPDPDLPLLLIDEEWVEKIKNSLPELPQEKLARLQSEYGISEYEATIISSDRELAEYFEEVVKKSGDAKKSANWILRDLLGIMKEKKVELDEILIKPEMLGELISEIEKGIINSSTAREVFEDMAESGKYPSIIIQEKGLQQIGSEDVLRELAQNIISANPKQTEQFRGGNERIFSFFIGQAMKQTKGKADPEMLNTIFLEELNG